jgi:pilus assembly protein Flp/PilA
LTPILGSTVKRLEIPHGSVNISWYTRLIHDESGQDLIEYALLAGIVALGATTAMRSVSTAINSVFTSVVSKI